MLRSTYIIVRFFFQAEDGIRDADVTGVQTCALPIYDRFRPRHAGNAEERFDLIAIQLRSGIAEPGQEEVVFPTRVHFDRQPADGDPARLDRKSVVRERV